MALRFNVDPQKALEALCWIARQWPGVTPFYVAKIMFYAEKKHLNSYGRPIVADTFIAMTNGPVPSTIYDFINGNFILSPIAREINAAIHVDRTENRYAAVNATRDANLDFLSESDIECLEAALRLCRPNGNARNFGTLSDMTHRERAWINAGLNQPMDYEDLIDADNPKRNEIIEHATMHAAHGVL